LSPTRPRLLLVPEFTELQWTIKPELQEWAEVRSYDPPGVGKEPLPGQISRDAVVQRGLKELDEASWERLFIAADGWAIATAVRIAEKRREHVAGLALGHAALSQRTEGERAPVNREVLAAMSQLIENDVRSFIRYGIAQVTKGSIDEDVAEQIVSRMPADYMVQGWEAFTADDPFDDALTRLDCPLLLAKHEGCLMSTDEGFEDAAAALPHAETLAVTDAPSTSKEFAAALRHFCCDAVK
jgi:hypothetical protein